MQSNAIYLKTMLGHTHSSLRLRLPFSPSLLCPSAAQQSEAQATITTNNKQQHDAEITLRDVLEDASTISTCQKQQL